MKAVDIRVCLHIQINMINMIPTGYIKLFNKKIASNVLWKKFTSYKGHTIKFANV